MLERFRAVNADFPHTPDIEQWNQRGGVFGWVCTYVPEEIIHAAGILPVRVTGYSHEMELEDGNAYLSVNTCSFSRSCLQLALRGEYDFLDGLVTASTCDGARRLYDVWKLYLKTPFFHMVNVPRKFHERAIALYLGQLREFRAHIEEFTGKEITDDALDASIALYNETRALLSRLYALRLQDGPTISGVEAMEVMNAGFRMSRETFNVWLAELLQELESRPPGPTPEMRLMVSGSLMTNPEFVAQVEKLGALVVTDELCTGTRYWSDPVRPEPDEAPLAALARRYLTNFPCARMVPAEERFDRVLAQVKEFRIDGVVSEIVRYCVPYAHDLPLLALDIEYGTSGSGQIATRVQAFMEMLEARVW